MGLLLICPHCQSKIPLVSRTCPACRADLRDLAPDDRRYFIGKPAAGSRSPGPGDGFSAPSRRPWSWNWWSRTRKP